MVLANARHILLKTQEQAEKIKLQLERGGDFALLAKKYSLCPTGKKGGDLGEFGPGKMVKAIDNIIFKKPVLKIHGPVKTKFGYHLVQTIFRN